HNPGSQYAKVSLQFRAAAAAWCPRLRSRFSRQPHPRYREGFVGASTGPETEILDVQAIRSFAVDIITAPRHCRFTAIKSRGSNRFYSIHRPTNKKSAFL